MITLVVDFHSSTMYLQSQKFLALVTTLKYFFQSVRKILLSPYSLLALSRFPYYSPIADGEKIWFHVFHKGISMEWNANIFVQDLKSGCQFHFLSALSIYIFSTPPHEFMYISVCEGKCICMVECRHRLCICMYVCMYEKLKRAFRKGNLENSQCDYANWIFETCGHILLSKVGYVNHKKSHIDRPSSSSVQ